MKDPREGQRRKGRGKEWERESRNRDEERSEEDDQEESKQRGGRRKIYPVQEVMKKWMQNKEKRKNINSERGKERK